MAGRIRPFVLLFFLIIVMGGGFGCSQKSETTIINLSDLQPVQETASDNITGIPLRIAIASVISPTETLTSYSQLVWYLGQKLHQEVEVVQRSNYAEINDLVESGYVDLAFVCSLAYVVGNGDFGMELLVIPEVNGKTTYNSYFLVPQGSDAETIFDLKGKSFAFTDPLSNTGRLYPTYILAKAGVTPENFFNKYLFTYSHDKSIRAVADKIVDGAAIDSLVYEYMVSRQSGIENKTKIIHVSPAFGIPPVVIHPDLEPEIKARLRGLLLNMNQDEEGAAILSEINVSRFVLGDDSSYDLIRQMQEELGN